MLEKIKLVQEAILSLMEAYSIDESQAKDISIVVKRMFHLYVEDVFQYKADEIVEVYRYLDKLEIDKTKLKTDPPYQIKEYLTLDISFVRRDERKEERIRIYEEVRCLTTNG